MWMIDHIDLANRRCKKGCFIVSSSSRNTHFVQSCQLRSSWLSLVRITPRRRHHAKKSLVLRGIFIFQMDLLLYIGWTGSIKALYMESTENTPFLVSSQWNSSTPCVNQTEANLYRSSFQQANRGPIRSRLKEIEGKDICFHYPLQGIALMSKNIV
jgi:hypothetical protein